MLRNNFDNAKSYDAYQVELRAPIGSRFNIKAAYWHFENKDEKNLGIWGVGADATFARDWKVRASVADQSSDADYFGANGQKPIKLLGLPKSTTKVQIKML